MERLLARLRLPFMVLSLAYASCASAQHKASGNPALFVSDKGFSVHLPAGWEQKKDFMGAVVVAISPPEGKKDAFRENVNVVVDELMSPLTTAQYYASSLASLKQVFKNFHLEKQGTAAVGGQTFQWVLFTHQLGDVNTKVLQYMTVTGKKAYVITCSATPSEFPRFQPYFDQVVQSFRLSNPPAAAARSIARKRGPSNKPKR